jgi:hypothetical protein
VKWIMRTIKTGIRQIRPMTFIISFNINYNYGKA